MNFRISIRILLAAMLALYGCSAPAASGNSSPSSLPSEEASASREDELLSSMSLREKLEQMIIIDVRTWNGSDFTEMNEEAAQLFQDYHFGGVILFSENYSDAAGTAGLILSMQQLNQASGGYGMFIGIDQEGGVVCRLKDGTSMPGNMALAASGNPDHAEQAAEVIGEELSVLGINTDFAPDADVNSNPANPVIGVRSFSEDPETAGTYALAYQKGLNQNNIIACWKHFPGHGDTSEDSHTSLPSVDKSLAELEKTELVPFRMGIDSGIEMVMSAHIQFPEEERETAISQKDGREIVLPASLSHAILTDYLRGTMGYEGVITTDSLQMDAIAQNFTKDDAARLAIQAGADILLMPIAMSGKDSIDQMNQYLDSLEAMVKDGTISEEQIDESVLRILKLKQSRGILERDYSTIDADQQKERAAEIVGSEDHHETERKLADDAVTVLAGRDSLPFDPAGKKIVFAGAQQSETNALEYGWYRLKQEGHAEGEAVFLNYDFGRNLNALKQAVSDADLVVITSWYDNLTQLDPEESSMIPSVQEITELAKEKGIPCAVISAGVPYDCSSYPDASILAAVYNPTGVSSLNEDHQPEGTYGPNIPAALDVLFGEAEGTGTLPVTIPERDGKQFTDTPAYERGAGQTE